MIGSGIIPQWGFLNRLIAPPGTRMPFNQSTSPVGWTTDGSSLYTDCAMRLNQSTAGGTGGSSNWSGWYFGGTFNCNSFTISVSQMPTHSHSVNDPGHAMSASTGGNIVNDTSGGTLNCAWNCNNGGFTFGLTGTTVNAAGVSVGSTGSGASVTPTFTSPQVKYTDHIIGVKS